MKKRRFLICRPGAVILSVFIVVGGLIAWLEIAPPTDSLEARLSERLGMHVRGRIAVSFFPTIGISFSDVVFETKDTAVLPVKRITAGIAIAPLFKGRIRPDTLFLDSPVITIRRDKSGGIHLPAILDSERLRVAGEPAPNRLPAASR